MPKRTPPMPADFPIYAAIEGNLKLRKRFHVGGVAIEKWRAELGVRFIQPDTPKKVRAKTVARKRVKRRLVWQERIEDLEDYDIVDVACSLGLRSFERDW